MKLCNRVLLCHSIVQRLTKHWQNALEGQMLYEGGTLNSYCKSLFAFSVDWGLLHSGRWPLTTTLNTINTVIKGMTAIDKVWPKKDEFVETSYNSTLHKLLQHFPYEHYQINYSIPIFNQPWVSHKLLRETSVSVTQPAPKTKALLHSSFHVTQRWNLESQRLLSLVI